MRIKIATLLAVVVSFSLTCHAATPQVTGVSPASGPVGTPVQITGSGFGPTQGTSALTFNGKSAVVATLVG